MAKKRACPQTIRRATETHLLRAGTYTNTIRDWLRQACLGASSAYAEVDLEMKIKALATCEEKQEKPWREKKGLMESLRTL